MPVFTAFSRVFATKQDTAAVSKVSSRDISNTAQVQHITNPIPPKVINKKDGFRSGCRLLLLWGGEKSQPARAGDETSPLRVSGNFLSADEMMVFQAFACGEGGPLAVDEETYGLSEKP